MVNEITVNLNKKNYKAFLQEGFYLRCAPVKRAHCHNFAEIHLIAGGDAVLFTDEGERKIKSGSVLLIPQGIFHYFTKDEKTLQTAFEINLDEKGVLKCELNESIILEFFNEIEKCKTSGDYTIIASYMSLILSYLTKSEKLYTQPVNDYAYLIHSFFFNRYGEEVHLCDLAEALHLSERQTERVVKQHTGRTFLEYLAKVRIEMAEKLTETTNMTQREIAEYVGYKSYAGYFKAKRKK